MSPGVREVPWAGEGTKGSWAACSACFPSCPSRAHSGGSALAGHISHLLRSTYLVQRPVTQPSSLRDTLGVEIAQKRKGRQTPLSSFIQKSLDAPKGIIRRAVSTVFCIGIYLYQNSWKTGCSWLRTLWPISQGEITLLL